MANGNERHFAGNFMEVQYEVNLWTAHLILEYGNPDDELRNECLEIITRYSTTPMSKILADEEAQWLERYNEMQETKSRVERLRLMLRDVMTYYNLDGCQCSFPRFRQMTAIDCSDSRGSFYVLETEGLIMEARRHFDTIDIDPFPENSKQIWTCKTCKSIYEFGWCDFSIHVNRSYLKVKELKAMEIGSPPGTPIPVFMGAIGHSIPLGQFIHVPLDQMVSYLKD